MYAKRIRVSAAVLIVSFAVLMASAGEVRATNGQAIPKVFAVCASGRCVRAVGHVVMIYQGQVVMRTGAILMLDLVNRYLGADSPGGGSLFRDVKIDYYRFMIYVEGVLYYPFTMYIRLKVAVGLPNGVIAQVYIPAMNADQIFLGLGSFYNKMESAPWL